MTRRAERMIRRLCIFTLLYLAAHVVHLVLSGPAG